MRLPLAPLAALPLAALCLALAFAAPAHAATCGWNGYDFSSLAGADLAGSDGEGLYDYSLRLCAPLRDSPCSARSPQSSACQIEKPWVGGVSFTAGNWPQDGAVPWSFIDGANPYRGVQYRMKGDQTCWAEGNLRNHEAIVQLRCARDSAPLRVEVNGCVQTYILSTPLACPAGPHPDPQPDIKGCSWRGYDFSALGGADLQAVEQPGSGVYDFSLRVCGVLSGAASCLQQDGASSACQVQVNPRGASFVIGRWPAGGSGVQWAHIDPNRPERGVSYRLHGAASCWAAGKPDPYYANVNFECARQGGEATVIMNGCVQNYTIPTPLACPEALATRLALE